eukprot:275957_1
MAESDSALSFDLVEYDADLIDEHGNILGDDQDHKNSTNKEEGELRQILNSLLPPIKLNGDHYKQVSLNKPTRSHVIALQKEWDDQLQIRQARDSGICSVREQLNEEALNELIRQMSINLPERGLLALRIKNEAKMTIQTYQTLYESSLSFGMRKCIQSQNDVLVLRKEITNAQSKKKELKQKLNELQIQKQNYEKLYNEQNQILQKNQNQEKEFLKHQKSALQNYLKT